MILSATPDDVRLDLLGGFQLRARGEVIDLPVSAQRLLAFVALHDRPLLRTNVAGILWNDTSEERSSANLRSSLWRLRRPGVNLIEARRSDLRLDPGVRVDVHEVMELAHRLIGGTGCGAALELDESTLAGDLLPDWYEDWVLIERERVRQLRLHALEALAEARLRAGRYGEAAEAALAAVSGEPLRESAQRMLIRVHLEEGNVVEALRQYTLYRELLSNEIGVCPSPQLEAMVAELTLR